MSERVCCARGHEWEPPRGAGPDSPCPVCGSSALAPETPRATTAGVTPGGDTVRSLPALPGYELLEELGRGGMAIVYFARDPRMGREVAIKLMSGANENDYLYRQRFTKEVKI